MTEFRYLRGAVYIFENAKAQRVKIGMTINDIAGRLTDLNQKWLDIKITCQICGGRRKVNKKGLVPRHVTNGGECRGGNELPFERDVSFAESYLESMKKRLSELSGNELGSAVQKIKNLEKRIEKFRHYKPSMDVWRFRVAYHTECAEQTELLSHEILAERLDKKAPIGEVFCCSVSEASEAVEKALSQLGLLHSARKEIQIEKNDQDEIEAKKGFCFKCGKKITPGTPSHTFKSGKTLCRSCIMSL